MKRAIGKGLDLRIKELIVSKCVLYYLVNSLMKLGLNNDYKTIFVYSASLRNIVCILNYSFSLAGGIIN